MLGGHHWHKYCCTGCIALHSSPAPALNICMLCCATILPGTVSNMVQHGVAQYLGIDGRWMAEVHVHRQLRLPM